MLKRANAKCSVSCPGYAGISSTPPTNLKSKDARIRVPRRKPVRADEASQVRQLLKPVLHNNTLKGSPDPAVRE